VRRGLDLEINGFKIGVDCVEGCWWMVNCSILDLNLLAFGFNWARVKRDEVVLVCVLSLRELILKKLITTNF